MSKPHGQRPLQSFDSDLRTPSHQGRSSLVSRAHSHRITIFILLALAGLVLIYALSLSHGEIDAAHAPLISASEFDKSDPHYWRNVLPRRTAHGAKPHFYDAEPKPRHKKPEPSGQPAP